jgi:hypothetical protein
MRLYDGDTFERGGVTFRVRLGNDDVQDAPWDRSDGHGPVRRIRSRDHKAPGERILAENRGYCWVYDWQAACKMARKDGWNAAPFDAPHRIERAVQADFDYLRRWLTDDWCYIGVVVERLDDEGSAVADSALWGIESDAHDYISEVANELADELLAEVCEVPA